MYNIYIKWGIYMNMYITPNDADVMSKTDSKSIQNAVDKALKEGINRVLIPVKNERTGKNLWEIDEAIILNSNIEIVLDNCCLRQKDGCMDNVFRNFYFDKIRNSYEEQQENIIIRGVGNAVIDGGNHNGLTEKTSLRDGRPSVRMNNMILLHNLRGFSIKNITLKNQRWWAVNLLFCEKGVLSEINIDAKCNVENQDGIDLRFGCHDIVIENIFGQSGDDFIALTGLYGGGESKLFEVSGKSVDIHDIIIKNVIATSADCNVVALRNHDGVKMYNITIDSIHDTLNGNENVKDPVFQLYPENTEKVGAKSPYSVVRLNQQAFWTVRPAKKGEFYNINVTNVHSRCNTPIMICADLDNSYIGNIYAGGKSMYAITTKSNWSSQIYGANLDNVVIENIYFTSDREESTVLDFDINDKKCEFKNTVINNVFCNNAKTALNMQHGGELVINNMFGNGEIIANDNANVVVNGKKINQFFP